MRFPPQTDPSVFLRVGPHECAVPSVSARVGWTNYACAISTPTHLGVAAIVAAYRASRSADRTRPLKRPSGMQGRRSSARATAEMRPHLAQIARPDRVLAPHP